MSSDETPKIEPTLVLKDAPSIAADAPKPEATIQPGEVAVVEAPKAASPALDAAKAEAKVEAEVTPPEPEPPKTEAPTLPRAPQLGEQGPRAVQGPRVEARIGCAASPLHPLCAACRCVAIAASFGAVAGSLGVAKLGPVLQRGRRSRSRPRRSTSPTTSRP